jgi:PAS domain S-box-containing protein
MESYDPNGLQGLRDKLKGMADMLKDPAIAKSFGVDYNDLAIETLQQLANLHLTNVRDVAVKCEEALNRIGSLDFTIPIEVDDSAHVGNYFAHSLNVLMEELESRVFPFQMEVLDSISDMVIVTNQRGLIKRSNKSFFDLCGYSIEELQDKHISGILYPTLFAINLKSGFTLKNADVKFLDKKNELIPVSLTINEVKGFRNLTQGFIFIAKNLRD